MAIKKICGIETEYGIIHTGSDQLGPILASSHLINAYIRNSLGHSPKWDFEDESPGLDVRGHISTLQFSPEVEAQFMNAVLTNAARYYVDHAHPEFSSPESSNAKSALLYDRAGEEILKDSMEAVNTELVGNGEIIVYKNNSDGKGNSYGCHENYLISRDTPFSSIAVGATSHFVTRQIYTGAGKVGSEVQATLGGQKKFDSASSRGEGVFQLSQRADFIEEKIGLETTLKRPIINTRDEPHSYPDKYRRFHVIVGDANMSQTATFLKLGTTAIVMSMIEDDFWNTNFIFANPVQALRQVSNDLSLKAPLELEDGSSMSAIEIQWEIFNHAQKYAETQGLESVGIEVGQQVLELWEEVLTALENDPLLLANKLDWVAKKKLMDGYIERHNLNWEDARLKALDLQYHDLRPTHSISARLNLDELVDTDDVRKAQTQPPEDTRAYFRGMCLQNFAENIVAINWDSVVFRLDNGDLKRISMMEPTKGTKVLTQELFAETTDLQELINKIKT